MGSAERREREKEERRQAILGQARSLFLEKGYNSVTLDDLASACELAKGTLYLYFPSKAELLGTLALEVPRDLSTRFDQALAAPLEPAETLARMGLHYIEHYHSQREMAPLAALAGSRALQQQLSPALQQAWGQENGRAIAQLAQAIAGCVQAGLLMADLDPLEFALTLAGCSYGLVDMASQCGEMLPVAPEVFVARGWALLLGAVSAPGVEPGRFLVQPAAGN